ncbi:MAG: hypothetical protein RIC35_04200 [Marinoscillum sp.]
MRKKSACYILFLTFLFLKIGFSQGVSFSYLIPKNGYLSAPVSPFSVRGLGFGKIVGIETGATLYNVPGLGMEDLPFESDKPLVGPHFSILVPADLFLRIPIGSFTTKLMAGGFTWWNINPRINEGNMDRAFRDYEDWEVLNTSLSYKDKLGLGLLGGVEFQLKLNDKLSLSAEAVYLIGSAKATLNGSYSGVENNGSSVITREVNITDASTTLEGLEISLGAVFSVR